MQPQLALQENENNLRILSEQLTTLIETIPDAILLKDDKGRLLIANECDGLANLLSSLICPCGKGGRTP